MAAGFVGYNYHLEELVYADAGYVNYGEQFTLRNRKTLKVYYLSRLVVFTSQELGIMPNLANIENPTTRSGGLLLRWRLKVIHIFSAE